MTSQRKSKNTLVAISLLLAAQTGLAEGFYFGVGYDFRPGSSDVFLGYQKKYMAIEANIFNMGKEEPTTRPGVENSLNVLAFVPSLPLFIKAGFVTGSSGKNGYDFGAGADFALNDHWAIRCQITHFKVTEDLGEASETENIFSTGLKYQF